VLLSTSTVTSPLVLTSPQITKHDLGITPAIHLQHNSEVTSHLRILLRVQPSTMPGQTTLPPELLFSIADKCSMKTIALCLCRVNHHLYAWFSAYIRRRVRTSSRLPPTILLKLGREVPIQTLKRLCSVNRYYNKTLTPILYRRGVGICRRTCHSSDSPVIRHAIFRCDRNLLRKSLLYGLPAN
jgi:hypothetical protein